MKKTFNNIEYETVSDPDTEYGCSKCEFRYRADSCNKINQGDDNCNIFKFYWKKIVEPKIIKISSGTYRTVDTGCCSNCAFHNIECSEINNAHHCSENDCSFEKIEEDTSEVKYWADGSNYYQGIVRDIGKLFGIDAYTSDDGSIQDTVLAAKVYELVTGLVHENAKLKSKVASLELE